MRRVAVLRALKFGDLLCAVPALRALRRALPPGAEVTLIGLPWARELVGRYPHYLDRFEEFPGWPGLPEREPDLAAVPAFLARVQALRLDLTVQLHGSGPFVNPLVALFGAEHTCGFRLPGGYCPDPAWFLPWPDEGREVHRLLRLMTFLGAPTDGDHLEFPLRQGDHEALAAAGLAGHLRPGGYACIHPGASVPERRWPAERFAAVADWLAGRGLPVVLTGSAPERGLTREVRRRMRTGEETTDACGRTGLGALGALLAGARVLVCNDTGTSHLAAALRVPSVVLSTGDNPARWAPLDAGLHRVLGDAGGPPPVEAVIRHAAELLAGPAPAVPQGMGNLTPCDRSAY
jgi:ADP-heptose:LPS heptosyltransferase